MRYLILIFTFLLIQFSASQAFFWEKHESTIKGSIYKIAKAQNGRFFAATDENGIFFSDDNAETWTQTTDAHLKKLSVYDIVVRADKSIIALTGENGIFSSSDNGASWKQLDNVLKAKTAIRFLKHNASNTMFIGAEDGLYQSIDEGVTWLKLNTLIGSNLIFSLTQNSKGDIFAGTFTKGMFRSVDKGATWEQVNAGLLHTNKEIRSLTVLKDDHVLTTIYDSGIYVTKNGSNWDFISKNLPTKKVYCSITNSLNFLFVGSSDKGLFVSKDMGQTWKSLNDGLNTNEIIGFFMLEDEYLLMYTPDGIYKSTKSSRDPVSVKENQTFAENISLFPSPVINSATIQFSTKKFAAVKISMIDIMGNQVMKIKNDTYVAKHINDISFDASKLQAGTYFIVLNNGSQTQTIPFIKQ